jgi:hypothetical protein
MISMFLKYRNEKNVEALKDKALAPILEQFSHQLVENEGRKGLQAGLLFGSDTVEPNQHNAENYIGCPGCQHRREIALGRKG